MGKTLYDKVFDLHMVREVYPGQFQLFVSLHLIHEATSAQAFAMLEERGLDVRYPQLTFATADHVISTRSRQRPLADHQEEEMLSALERNVGRRGIRYFSPGDDRNGIVHVLGPEVGLTQPGLTIVCGDSHTSTHGAFGAIAFGIGTSQVRDVLATQTLLTPRLKVRRIEINGRLSPYVTAKDVILALIAEHGPKAGVGYAYEFGGEAVDAMSMDERMTLCNMAVEAGARCGYVNPDEITFEYLHGREFAPGEVEWDRAVHWWRSLSSDRDARYDDRVEFDASGVEPMVTWGTNLGQSVPIVGHIPQSSGGGEEAEGDFLDTCEFMGVSPGDPVEGLPIDVAFIGSCTNGRLSDFEEVALELKRSGARVAEGVQALVVPGSAALRNALMATGMDKVFEEAGFEFRFTGCSMCLAMNSDRLVDQQRCVSSSNRNFKGRQGAPNGRTLIVSPLTVAASAIRGKVSDPRSVFATNGVEA